MTWSVFDRKFGPITAPDGGDVFEYVDTKPYGPNNVWSMVDGDNGKSYILPGLHFVNVFGYMVTKEPWTDADLADLSVLW